MNLEHKTRMTRVTRMVEDSEKALRDVQLGFETMQQRHKKLEMGVNEQTEEADNMKRKVSELHAHFLQCKESLKKSLDEQRKAVNASIEAYIQQHKQLKYYTYKMSKVHQDALSFDLKNLIGSDHSAADIDDAKQVIKAFQSYIDQAKSIEHNLFLDQGTAKKKM